MYLVKLEYGTFIRNWRHTEKLLLAVFSENVFKKGY